MRLNEVLKIIDGRALTGAERLDMCVQMACGADLMSDVLAFTHDGTLLLTGLTNPQAVRTGEMAGVRAITFVRGKLPPQATISLAIEKGIPLLATRLTLYEACGRLFAAGLPSCGLSELSEDAWHDAFCESADGR